MPTLATAILDARSRGNAIDANDVLALFARIVSDTPSIGACIVRPSQINLGESIETATWTLDHLPITPDNYAPDTHADPETAFTYSIGASMLDALGKHGPTGPIPSDLPLGVTDIIIACCSPIPSDRADLKTVRRAFRKALGLKEEQKKRGWIGIVSVVSAFALVALGVAFLVHGMSSDGSQSTPQSSQSMAQEYQSIDSNALIDVSGLTLSDAKTKLSAYGRNINETYEVSPSVPVGSVISQNPEAGTDMNDYTGDISLVVSAGQKSSVVPNVVGMTSTDASSLLSALGITMTTHDVDSQNPSGTIISQSPEAGSTQNSVLVNVSTGKMPVPSITAGADVDYTVSNLERLGFTVKKESADTNDESLDGKVLSVSNSGNRIAYGSTLTMKVGHYVEPTPTPTPTPTPSATPTPTPTASTTDGTDNEATK